MLTGLLNKNENLIMKIKTFLLFLALLPSISFAQYTPNMFLKIDTGSGGFINGEIEEPGHENWIEILSWAWGGSSDGRSVCVQDISLVKPIDAASPDLLIGMVEGTVYPEVQLDITEFTPLIGSNIPVSPPYVQLLMKNVIVSSYSTGGAESVNRLRENISLKFDELIYKYIPIPNDGSSGTPSTATIYPRNNCR
jgi:type VI protein secretion system component Hcp